MSAATLPMNEPNDAPMLLSGSAPQRQAGASAASMAPIGAQQRQSSAQGVSAAMQPAPSNAPPMQQSGFAPQGQVDAAAVSVAPMQPRWMQPIHAPRIAFNELSNAPPMLQSGSAQQRQVDASAVSMALIDAQQRQASARLRAFNEPNMAARMPAIPANRGRGFGNEMLDLSNARMQGNPAHRVMLNATSTFAQSPVPAMNMYNLPSQTAQQAQRLPQNLQIPPQIAQQGQGQQSNWLTNQQISELGMLDLPATLMPIPSMPSMPILFPNGVSSLFDTHRPSNTNTVCINPVNNRHFAARLNNIPNQTRNNSTRPSNSGLFLDRLSQQLDMNSAETHAQKKRSREAVVPDRASKVAKLDIDRLQQMLAVEPEEKQSSSTKKKKRNSRLTKAKETTDELRKNAKTDFEERGIIPQDLHSLRCDALRKMVDLGVKPVHHALDGKRASSARKSPLIATLAAIRDSNMYEKKEWWIAKRK